LLSAVTFTANNDSGSRFWNQSQGWNYDDHVKTELRENPVPASRLTSVIHIKTKYTTKYKIRKP
jgi:hypothetical protein